MTPSFFRIADDAFSDAWVPIIRGLKHTWTNGPIPAYSAKFRPTIGWMKRRIDKFGRRQRGWPAVGALALAAAALLTTATSSAVPEGEIVVRGPEADFLRLDYIASQLCAR